MRYEPLDYESINQYNGTMSPTGTVQYDQTTAYFWRCLYHRLMSVIKFQIPQEWNYNYFQNILFGKGFIGIIKTAEYGIIPQICTVAGKGLYLQPKRVIVSQPLVKFEGTRGEDCEVIKLTPDWLGVLDIVDHYAYELATAYTSVNVSLINSRLGFLAYAKNKNAAETLKVIVEKLTSGEPVVVTDKQVKDNDMGSDEPIFTTAFDPARNYITDKLLDDMASIINEFDREIGVPVIDDKKERRIEAEVSSMTSDAGCRLDVWKTMLDESLRDVKEVFPELTISYTVRGDSYEPDTKDDNDRAVQLRQRIV